MLQFLKILDSWRNMVETFRRPTWGECGKESAFMQIVGRKLLPKIANKAWNVGPMFSGPRNRSVRFFERCDKWRHDKRNYWSQKIKTPQKQNNDDPWSTSYTNNCCTKNTSVHHRWHIFPITRLSKSLHLVCLIFFSSTTWILLSTNSQVFVECCDELLVLGKEKPLMVNEKERKRTHSMFGWFVLETVNETWWIIIATLESCNDGWIVARMQLTLLYLCRKNRYNNIRFTSVYGKGTMVANFNLWLGSSGVKIGDISSDELAYLGDHGLVCNLLKALIMTPERPVIKPSLLHGIQSQLPKTCCDLYRAW